MITMEKIKKDLIIDLLNKHELKSADVFSIANDVENVIDSEYQTFTEATRDFEEWTDQFNGTELFEIKQTEHEFKARPHYEKQKYMSW